MLSIIKYTVISLLREKANIIWPILFVIFMSCLFYVMFSGMENAETYTAQQVGIVKDQNFENAMPFVSMIDSVSGRSSNAASEEGSAAVGESSDSTKASSEAQPTEGTASQSAEGAASQLTDDSEAKIIDPVWYESVDAAQEALQDSQIDSYIVVDSSGTPTLYVSPKANGSIGTEVISSMLDSYVQTYSQVNTLMSTSPEFVSMLSGLSYDNFENSEIMKWSANQWTQDLAITNHAPDSSARYYFALLAMACGMAMSFSMMAAKSVQPSDGSLGARRTMASIPRSKVILGVLVGSWICAFCSLMISFLFMRYVISVDFGGRDGLCIVGIAVASAMSCSIGAFLGTFPKIPVAIVAAISCLLCLFVGLYGPAAQSLADYITQSAPVLQSINPLWQTTNLFYSLMYYDTLAPFGGSCMALIVMAVVFMAAAIVRMRRQMV